MISFFLLMQTWTQRQIACVAYASIKQMGAPAWKCYQIPMVVTP